MPRTRRTPIERLEAEYQKLYDRYYEMTSWGSGERRAEGERVHRHALRAWRRQVESGVCEHGMTLGVRCETCGDYAFVPVPCTPDPDTLYREAVFEVQERMRELRDAIARIRTPPTFTAADGTLTVGNYNTTTATSAYTIGNFSSTMSNVSASLNDVRDALNSALRTPRVRAVHRAARDQCDDWWSTTVPEDGVQQMPCILDAGHEEDDEPHHAASGRQWDINDCPHGYRGHQGLTSRCELGAGHAGPHSGHRRDSGTSPRSVAFTWEDDPNA